MRINRVCLSLLMILVIIGVRCSTESTYKFWSPDLNKELWCPEDCYLNSPDIEINYCCSCDAVPPWELLDLFPNITYIQLSVEIPDVRGQRSKLVTEKTVSNNSYFGFVHVNGYLRNIPENACDFQLVTVDLTGNMLTRVGNVSCNIHLDKLILKRNFIEFVSNTTFVGLSKLRIVDLSENMITKLDNYIFRNIHVFTVDFGRNSLKILDVSNALIPNKTLCYHSFAFNKYPLTVTNDRDVQFGNNTSVVCGSMDYANVTLSENPLSLVSKDIPMKQISKYVPCGFYEFSGSAYNCDCKVGEYLQTTLDIFQRIWKKPSSQSYCSTPQSLANIPVEAVWYNDTMRDEMTCDIIDNCPKRPDCHCQCTSQPSRLRLIVDCSNQSCRDFPETVPDSRFDYHIYLNMSNNLIRNVIRKSYFTKVRFIDLSGNAVSSLSEEIGQFDQISEIMLPDHNLKDLPKSVQLLSPNVFQFGQKGIPCTCDNQWIGRWRTLKNAAEDHKLYCRNYIDQLFEEIHLRDCKSTDYSVIIYLSLFVAIIIGLPICLYHFRNDMIILKRRLQCKQRNYFWKTDLYISCDEENNDVRYFVVRMLIPFLERKVFSTYIHCRDASFGLPTHDNIIYNMKKCKNVLVIHSKGMYDGNNSTCDIRRTEYNLGWKYFKTGEVDKIFIVNFDNSVIRNFQYVQTKCLYRFGLGVNICDRKTDIYQKILQFLGKPLISPEVHDVNTWLKNFQTR